MIKPCNDKILLRVESNKSKEVNGKTIHIETASKEYEKLFVVEVGLGRLLPDNSRQPIDLYTNQEVILYPHTAAVFYGDDKTKILVSESDIWGVIA